MGKEISIDKDVYEQLEARAKEKGLTVQQYVCDLIHEKTEFILVTVSVPKNVMQLLVAEGFFHNEREEWFTNAVISGLDAELNDMDHNIERELRKKYGLN